MGMNHATGLVEIQLHDRPTFVGRLESVVKVGTAFRRSDYRPENRELTIELNWGPSISIEIGAEDGSDLIPEDRPIVYLDQLHWVAIARSLWAPGKLARRDRSVCARFVQLARAKEIILPLSTAHVVETARCDGRWRRDLATTMLDLSRGWLMRDPLEVRQRELMVSMTGATIGSTLPPARSWVFTLEPDAIFSKEWATDHRSDRSSDLPSSARELVRRLSSISALAEVLLEDEIEDSVDGKRMSSSWASGHQKLAKYMRDHRTPREHARINAKAFLLGDLKQELVDAAQISGTSSERFDNWIHDFSEGATDPMPSLDRLNEITFLRLRNADDQWERNDLNDMHFLSCAAGYADLVVGENKTSHYLNLANRNIGSAGAVCSSLPDAENYLNDLLAPED